MSASRVIAGAALAVIVALSLLPRTAMAQKMPQDKEVLENPFIPERSTVSFSGTGSAQFTPQVKAGTMATPAPNCLPRQTQVGFQVECMSNSSVKTVDSCHGTMSFYAFNVTRNVSGTITGTPDSSFTMTLKSPDGAIEDCTLANQSAATAGTANPISMQSCELGVEGCSGEVVGAGAEHLLTSSGAVTVSKNE